MRGQGESGQTGQLSKPMLSAALAQPPSLSSQFCMVVRASVVLVQRNLHQNAKGQGSETFWSVAHRGRSDGGRPGSPQHGSPHHALHTSSSVSCARFTTTVCQMCFPESCELLQQTNQTERGPWESPIHSPSVPSKEAEAMQGGAGMLSQGSRAPSQTNLKLSPAAQCQL